MKTKEVPSQIVKTFLIPFKGRGLGKLPPVDKIYRLRMWISLQGHKIYVNARDKSITPTLLNYGIWEKYETELFRRVVGKRMIVVDLGANIGWYTLIAAKLVGKEGKVYAFEPDLDNYALLKKNVQINGYDNVIVEQKAILNRCGPIRLFLSLDYLGTHRICDFRDDRKWITVEGITLDEYFKNKNDKIDVIKIDVEGAEMVALLGMDRVIKANEKLKMFVEFWPMGITRSGFSPREFLDKLLEYGFKIYVIDRQKEVIERMRVDEVMELCEGEKSADLFLEK